MPSRKGPPRSLRHAAAKAAGNADAPMTPEQIGRLQELSRRAGDTDAFDEMLTRGEAAKRIAALEALLEREEHSGRERLPRT